MAEVREGRTQAPATPWGLVVLLGALTAFAPMSIDMYLPALPEIGRSLGASAAQAQGTVSAFLAGMALGQFVYGPASDRFGRRPPIIVGVVIYTLATIACALATSGEALMALRFVQALGGCAGSVVARAVIRDRFDHTETARMLSLMMLIMGVAPILAPVLGGLLLQVAGWRSIFWVLAVFGLVVGTFAIWRMEETRSPETEARARGENPLRAFAVLLRQPRLVGYVLAGALNGAVLFTYIAASPSLLIGSYGVSPQQFSWIFGLNAFGVIGSSQLNRALLRRWTPDVVLARASLVAAGLGVLLALEAVTGIGGPWAVLPLLFLLLATYGLMSGNTMAGALSVDPLRAGSISALAGGASFASGALASSVAGALTDGTARPMALTICVAVVGSAAALHLLALPRRR